MPSQPSHLTQSIVTELEVLSKAVSDDVARRSRVKKSLADLRKAVTERDADAVARLLSAHSTMLTELYPGAKPTLEKLQVDITRQQDEQVRQTYDLLDKYCRAENISLRGSAPRFIVDHLIEVELDKAANRSKIGTQALNTLKWNAIRDALDAERRRVWERAFDPLRFRDLLLEIYQDLERLLPNPSGWLPLEQFYQVLRQRAEQENPDFRKEGRLVAYYKDEFSADLSRLWRAQTQRQVGSPHIELSSIRDPRRAFRVLQPDETVGSYGFMRPREVQQ